MVVWEASVLYTLASKLLIKTPPFGFSPYLRKKGTRKLFLGTVCASRQSLIPASPQVAIKTHN